MTSLLKNKTTKSVPKSNNLATLAFKLIQQLNSYAESHRLQNKELTDSYQACEQNSKNKLASVEVLHNKAIHKVLLLTISSELGGTNSFIALDLFPDSAEFIQAGFEQEKQGEDDQTKRKVVIEEIRRSYGL